MTGRVEVRRERRIWTRVLLYRVVEEGTDEPCHSWLPGLEEPERLPLDRGGFGKLSDAKAFALGVNWERAYHGQLDGVSTADIDRERAELDWSRPEPRKKIRPASEAA